MIHLVLVLCTNKMQPTREKCYCTAENKPTLIEQLVMITSLCCVGKMATKQCSKCNICPLVLCCHSDVLLPCQHYRTTYLGRQIEISKPDNTTYHFVTIECFVRAQICCSVVMLLSLVLFLPERQVGSNSTSFNDLSCRSVYCS